MQQRHNFRRAHHAYTPNRYCTGNSPSQRLQSSSTHSNQLSKHRRIMTDQNPVTTDRRPNSHDAVMKALKLSNPFETRSHINDYVARTRKKRIEDSKRDEYYAFTPRSRQPYLSLFDQNRNFRYRVNSDSLDSSRMTHCTPYIPPKIYPGKQFFPEIYHPNSQMSPSTYYYLLGQCIPQAKQKTTQNPFQNKYFNSNAGSTPNYEYQRNGDNNYGHNFTNNIYSGDYGTSNGGGTFQSYSANDQFTGTISHQFQHQNPQQQHHPSQQLSSFAPQNQQLATGTFNNPNSMQFPQQPQPQFPQSQQPFPQQQFPQHQQSFPVQPGMQRRPSIQREVIGYESQEQPQEEDKPKAIKVRGKEYFLVNLQN